MAVYCGIDLGGTNIKAAVVDEHCNILAQADRPTNSENRSSEEICDDIVASMDDALKTAGLTRESVHGVGLGCPGTIDDKAGVVVYSNNIQWKNYPLRQKLKERSGFSVGLGNDANVAALGEVYAGCARGASSAVIITLGTGVGSGVVLDGHVWTGFNGAAAEIGHMAILDDGYPCTCGRLGCLEAYASATALIRQTKEAALAHPASLLAQMVHSEGASGKTSFAAASLGDEVGKAVVKQYCHYLAVGLANIINIYFPEVIGLSGGISKEGETLLAPVREEAYSYVFGGMKENKTRITQCELGYKAGLVGAAMLGKQWTEE